MKSLLLLILFALALPAQFDTRRAPGFSLPEVMTRKQFDLMDFRGKVVVLEFMRTDCPRCRTLSTALEQVKSKYAGKLQVLNIVTQPDTDRTVAAYVNELKLTSPVLYDCSQVMISYLRLTPQNPTVHLPTVYVIDRAGMIRREIKGEAATAAEVLGAIAAAVQ
jgi:peroxiredoxin